ncbi:MAG: hypothetical protein IJP33_04155 [Firmicutes bacterium]|nr:hypothetical protein [Bacillota bacterium]
MMKAYYGEEKYDAAMDHMVLVFIEGLCTSTINWLKSGYTSATIEEKAVLCSKFLTPEIRYLIEHPIPEISIGNFNK